MMTNIEKRDGNQFLSNIDCEGKWKKFMYLVQVKLEKQHAFIYVIHTKYALS